MQISSIVKEKLNKFGVQGQMLVENPIGDILEGIELSAKVKNYAINSGFKYLQGKAASATAAPSANGYHFDQFATITVAGTINLSRQSSSAPAGSEFYKRVAYAAGSSRYVFGQAFEASIVEQLAGKSVILGVKVKKNSTFNQSVVVKLQSNATGDTFSGGTWSDVASVTVASADISASEFTQIEIAADLSSSIAGLRISIGDSAAPTNGSQLDYAQVQLCVADELPEYELFGGSDAADYAACLRYFVAIIGAASGLIAPSVMVGCTANKVQFVHPLPLPMRSAPTAAFVGSRGTDYALEDIEGAADADGVFASGAAGNPASVLHGAYEFADTAAFTASTMHRINLLTASGQLTFSARL